MTATDPRRVALDALKNIHSALLVVTRQLSNSAGALAQYQIPAERLRSELLSLGALVSALATRLGVASKSPISGQAGWEAVREIASQLGDAVSKLSFAAGKLGPSFMAKELRWTTTDLLESIMNLALELVKSLERQTVPMSERERHLQLVGMVWQNAEKLKECSASEADALSRALTNEVEVMQDGLDEARDLLDATGSIQSDNEEDDADDEALSELERRRVENAIRLLTAAKRLVKRIITLLKRSPLPTIDGFPTPLARVHAIVSALVASEDELVSMLPGPQDVVHLRESATDVLKSAQELANLAVELWPPDPRRPEVDALIAELTLDDRASDKSVSLDVFPVQLADVERELAQL